MRKAADLDVRDHPRVCGENRIMKMSKFSVLGSSPRMRGKQTMRLVGDLAQGIIPAYAGKTYVG